MKRLSIFMAGVHASLAANIFPRASHSCTVHTVQPGETCFTIASDNNATFAQIVGWNPEINTVCS